MLPFPPVSAPSPGASVVHPGPRHFPRLEISGPGESDSFQHVRSPLADRHGSRPHARLARGQFSPRATFEHDSAVGDRAGTTLQETTPPAVAALGAPAGTSFFSGDRADGNLLSAQREFHEHSVLRVENDRTRRAGGGAAVPRPEEASPEQYPFPRLRDVGGCPGYRRNNPRQFDGNGRALDAKDSGLRCDRSVGHSKCRRHIALSGHRSPAHHDAYSSVLSVHDHIGCWDDEQRSGPPGRRLPDHRDARQQERPR